MNHALWYLIAALWALSLVLTWLGLRVIRGRVPDPEEQTPIPPAIVPPMALSDRISVREDDEHTRQRLQWELWCEIEDLTA